MPLALELCGRGTSFHRVFGWPHWSPGTVELVELLWWAAWAILLFGLIPARLVGWRVRDYGWRLPHGLKVYGLLYLGMLPALVWFSHDPHFRATYPFFHHARTEPEYLVIWWVAYAAMFVSLEFFFRGYLIFSLAPRFGAGALLWSAIPYFLSHNHKPLPEMLGSLPAGLALGYLSWRTGSIAGGVLVHLGVAFTMDLLVLFG